MRHSDCLELPSSESEKIFLVGGSKYYQKSHDDTSRFPSRVKNNSNPILVHIFFAHVHTTSHIVVLGPRTTTLIPYTEPHEINFEEIMNGAITVLIPEERTVCLESPSHNARVHRFREMFQEEAVATTVRKFLF